MIKANTAPNSLIAVLNVRDINEESAIIPISLKPDTKASKYFLVKSFYGKKIRRRTEPRICLVHKTSQKSNLTHINNRKKSRLNRPASGLQLPSVGRQSGISVKNLSDVLAHVNSRRDKRILHRHGQEDSLATRIEELKIGCIRTSAAASRSMVFLHHDIIPTNGQSLRSQVLHLSTVHRTSFIKVPAHMRLN